jgi:hypothetical protein
VRLQVDPELGRVVLEMMAAGKQMARICEATGLSKTALLEWLDETPERAEAATRARTRAAHSLVDEALQIADEADEENALALQKAKLRTQVRQWTAERWNKKDYGAAKAEVNVSITGLHFEALRARVVDSGDVIDVTPRPTDEELASL